MMKKMLINVLLIIAVTFCSFTLCAQEEKFDEYGGRKDLNINNGKGFFHLGKTNGKDFLVTPVGNAFKSIGINHTHMIPTNNYDEIIEDIKSLGFNSGDYQGPQWMWDKIPYSKGVNLLSTSSWLPENKFVFEDVFAPEFLSKLENKVKNIVAPMANKEMLICYFLTDIPIWTTTKYGQGWIDYYNSLEPNAAGKVEFEKWKEANPTRPEKEFIPIIARQVYSKGTEFIRKFDKNHLIFSDRYHEIDFSEEVANEVLPFVDGIAVQPKNYISVDFLNYLYNTFKKPVFIADHVSSYATNLHPITMAQVAKNSDDYAKFYEKSVTDALSLPFVVGYNKCQYMDEVKPNMLKQGLYKTTGEPYEYVSSLKKIHEKALEKAYSVETGDGYGLQDWGPYENIKQEAIERIEKFRKGNVNLKVFLPNGEKAANLNVVAKIKRHNFKWGAVIRESFFTSPYSDVYKQTFLKFFNATGFGLELKPKWREADFEKTIAEIAMPWLKDNNIYVRGHALAWEGYNYMRPEDKAIVDNTLLTDREKGEALLASCGKHFHYAIPKWDVNCWDVTNEPLTNNVINNLLPETDTHSYWFRLADSLRKVNEKQDVVLYINDYQIITAISPWTLQYKKDGFNSVGRPGIYHEMIQKMLENGTPIEGIGFQSRIKNGLLTPDTIYKRLCDFDDFKLPYHATEFEIRDNPENFIYTHEQRRLLTEYMMVMYFSHPNVEGFWHWTFFDNQVGTNWDYSLFNFDGSPNINGQIWIDLMEGFFNTEVETYTNVNGEININGYLGDYQITAEVDGNYLSGNFMIDSTNNTPFIEVILAGDQTTLMNNLKKKKDNNIIIKQSRLFDFIEIDTDFENTSRNQLSIEFYDLLGRKMYQRTINSTITRIFKHDLNVNGLTIVVARNKITGEKIAVKKVILI